MPRSLFRSIVFIVLALLQGAAAPGAAPQPAAHLTIRAAEVYERAAADEKAGGTSHVVFRLAVGAAPPCGAVRPPVTYTFLLDTDRSTNTGVTRPAVREIGIDARVEMRCDPETGRYTSESGQVQVTRTEHQYELELAVASDAIPGQEFEWIAVAREGKRYDRLPAQGRAAVWQSVVSWLW